MKRILILLLTVFSLSACAQSTSPPAGSKVYGNTTYLGPDNKLWFGTNPLLYRSVYNSAQVDALIAAIPVFDASLYYTKTASDARFYPLSTNPAGYLTSFTEVDPTVPAYAKSLSAFSVIKTSTDALYPSLTGSYVSPSWIASLAYSKITGAPDLSGYELLSNKSTSTSLGTSNTLYPTQNAVKTYVDGRTFGQTTTAGNTTNRAVYINGNLGPVSAFGGIGLSYDSSTGISSIGFKEGGAESSIEYNGVDIYLSNVGSSLSVGMETPSIAGVSVGGRMSGQPAINANEYVTLSQVPSGFGTVTSVTSANSNISVANTTTTPVLTLASTISSNTTGNAATATQAVNSTTTSAISGSTNYISKFTGSGTIGNSLIYDSGIGISFGGSTIFGGYEFLIPSFGNNTIYLGVSDGVQNPRAYISQSSSNGNQDVKLGSAFSSGNRTANWIFENGNVGIGTTSPSAKLDVNGTGNYTGNVTAPNILYTSTNQTRDGRLTLTSPNGTDSSSPTSSVAPLAVTGGRGGNNTNTTGFAQGSNANDISIKSGTGGGSFLSSGTRVGGNGGFASLIAGDAGDAGTGGTSGNAGTAVLQGGSVAAASTNSGNAGHSIVKGGQNSIVGGIGGSVYLIPGFGNANLAGSGVNLTYDGNTFLGVNSNGTMRGAVIIGSDISDLTNNFQVTGTSKFNGNLLSNPAPTTGDHLTNKTYVDGIDAGNVKISGTQTITGSKLFSATTQFTSGLLSGVGAGSNFQITNSNVSVANTTTGGTASLESDGSIQISANNGDKKAELRSTNVLGVKLFEFPNASGTLALTSDLTNFVNTTGNQTGIAGDKTWTGDQITAVGRGFYSLDGLGGSSSLYNGGYQSQNGNKEANLSYLTGLSINTSGTATASAIFKSDNLTGARVLQAPNASGTLALTSDLTNFVNTTGNQTGILGNKTFTGDIVGNGFYTGASGSNQSYIVPSTVYVGNTTTGKTVQLQNGGIDFGNGSFGVNLSLATLTANRNILLPNAAGTIALTSDIPNPIDFVDISNNQSGIAGNKSWTGTQTYSSSITQNSVGGVSNQLFSGVIQAQSPTHFAYMDGNSGASSFGKIGANAILLGDDLTAQRTYQMPNVSGILMVLDTTSSPPSTSSSAGKTGTVIISGLFRYECIATDTWVRSAVTTF